MWGKSLDFLEFHSGSQTYAGLHAGEKMRRSCVRAEADAVKLNAE